MVLSNTKHRIEIWSSRYINEPSCRREKDREAIIVQIEPSNDLGDFIVEIRDPDN